MKIKGMPGIYSAMAFIVDGKKLKLCDCFHISLSDAKQAHKEFFRIEGAFEFSEHNPKLQWPVEIEDGIAYVPHESELED